MFNDYQIFLILSLAQSFLVSLLVTFLIIPWLIQIMIIRGIVGKDRNKLDEPLIPEMGGLSVVLGYFSGVFVFVLTFRFAFGQSIPNTAVFLSGLLCILGASFVGAMDDILKLRQRVKAILPAFFGIPLAYYVITLGSKNTINLFEIIIINVPSIIMGIIILFGITAAANGVNLVEGYNGLGAGLALIMSSFLTFVSFYQHSYLTAFLLIPLIGSSLAFLKYNYYPSKIFPGDTFSLFYGATLAVAVIYGNLKEIGALLFIPMIIEFVLKAKGSFKAEIFSRPNPNTGNLEYRGPIESIFHFIIIRVPMKEKYLVWVFWLLQIIICISLLPLVI